MRNLYVLLVFVLVSQLNATNFSAQSELTGGSYYLENLDASISIELGNVNSGDLHAWHLTLPADLYRFRTAWNGGGSYAGGTGFPCGSTSGYALINIPAGTYNLHMGSGGGYRFVAISDRMLEGCQNTFNLYDTGDGTYCAIDAVVITNEHNGKFYFSDGEVGTYYGVTAFPVGHLVPNGSSFTITPGTYDICVTPDMAYSIVSKLSLDDFESKKAIVYPNPGQTEWNFTSTSNSIKSVKVYNYLGQIASKSIALENNFSVNCSALPAGIYFAHVSSDDGLQIIKLIKN